MLRRRFVLMTITALLVASQLGAQSGDANTEVRRQIAAVMQKFTTAITKADAATISQLYTADAIIAFNGEFRGKQILDYWTQNFRNFTFDAITSATEELTVTSDTAFEWAVWTQTFRRNASGETVVQRMRSLTAWKRQADGTWKIHRSVITAARLQQ